MMSMRIEVNGEEQVGWRRAPWLVFRLGVGLAAIGIASTLIAFAVVGAAALLPVAAAVWLVQGRWPSWYRLWIDRTPY